MKYLSVLVLLLSFILGAGTTSAQAQERGIGVSPERISIEEGQEFPFSQSILVKNLSDSTEWIEVSISRTLIGFAIAEPGHFALESGQVARVNLHFDRPESVEGNGVIRISGRRTSAEGISTGTGVEIPVVWQNQVIGESGASNLMASVMGIFDQFSGPKALAFLFLALMIIAIWRLSTFLARNSLKEKYGE